MQAVLFDLDGVIYQGETPIQGAADAVDWFRNEGIPHLFLTNTTSRPRRAIAEKLSRFGLEVDEDRILSPPVATRQWLARHANGPVALFVPKATRAEFSTLEVLSSDAESGAAAVILGDMGEDWDFETLNRAFRLLMDEPQPALIALGMTRYWRADDGLRLDTGPFVAALQQATGIEPVVLGKPAAPFFETALQMSGSEAAQTVMVGDDIRGDIGGAQSAGLKAVLVRTGKFKPEDLEGEIRPDAVIEDVTALPDWWQSTKDS
jgi:phospholysine phosphohistidine inorganic pyrophosphate phosphatase